MQDYIVKCRRFHCFDCETTSRISKLDDVHESDRGLFEGRDFSIRACPEKNRLFGPAVTSTENRNRVFRAMSSKRESMQVALPCQDDGNNNLG